MTNQEVIEKFKKIKRGNIYLIHQRIEGKEVIEDYSLCDMAISALQAQDVPDINVGDMISRQVAIDALCRRCDLAAEDDEPCTEKCNDIKILEKLPSAQPDIIRCRECKNCQIDSVFHDYWCDGRKVWKDHYCGYAERKDDE